MTHIVNRLDDLARKAGALTAAIRGVREGHFDNDDISGGIEDIAWEISVELRKLSDEALKGGTKLKAVPS